MMSTGPIGENAVENENIDYLVPSAAEAHYLKKGETTIWITPKEITELLGPFGTDPCAAAERPWDHARINYTIHDDGLTQPWVGRVWLNPPYAQGQIRPFTKQFIEHGNGIALVFPRVDTIWFQELGNACDVMLLPPKRIRFCRPGGEAPQNAALGNVFFAIGSENVEALKKMKGLLYERIKR